METISKTHAHAARRPVFSTLGSTSVKANPEIFNRSGHWIAYFGQNLKHERIDWKCQPELSVAEKASIRSSLQAWQLGETSDGKHLMAAARRYADRTHDMLYPLAVELFIKEEQKHGNNLGRYLDLIGEQRISSNWGDSLFRRVRYFNTSMEAWTLAVIAVESTAQVFYQSLKDATGCPLLKQICTDILIDEAAHIAFQRERLAIIFETKLPMSQWLAKHFYRMFFSFTTSLVWVAHRKVFVAGGVGFWQYRRKMAFKSKRIFGGLKRSGLHFKAALPG